MSSLCHTLPINFKINNHNNIFRWTMCYWYLFQRHGIKKGNFQENWWHTEDLKSCFLFQSKTDLWNHELLINCAGPHTNYNCQYFTQAHQQPWNSQKLSPLKVFRYMVVEIDRGVDINFPNICSIHYNQPPPPKKRARVRGRLLSVWHTVLTTLYIYKKHCRIFVTSSEIIKTPDYKGSLFQISYNSHPPAHMGVVGYKH